MPAEPEPTGDVPRILFVITSSDIGGSENMLRELALRLGAHGFGIDVCSLRPPGRIAEEIAAAGVHVHTLGMTERPGALELLRAVVRLGRLIDVSGADLVQSFLYRANVLTRLAARVSRRRPVVVSGQRSLTPLTGPNATFASRATRSLCERIVAVSEEVRDELVRVEGVPRERIVVIQNGVDTRRFAAAPGAGRERFGIRDPSTLVVAWVGRLSPEKGLPHLLEGVALARDRGVDVHLLCAGDGLERERLGQEVTRLGLDGHVTFLGPLRDLVPVYRASDVFALASLEEGSPNVLLEAMASGLAIVATHVGGVPELIEHDRSGLLVPPGSASALSEAIVRLAHAPALRARFAAEARRVAEERFDIDGTVASHAQLYRELLAARKAG